MGARLPLTQNPKRGFGLSLPRVKARKELGRGKRAANSEQSLSLGRGQNLLLQILGEGTSPSANRSLS